MTVPLFLLAALWQRLDLGRRRWLRGREFRLGPLQLRTTSTISGLLFVAVAGVFLLTDGTAGLLGADPRTAAAAENTAAELGRHVPDLALLAAGAVAVLVVVAWRLGRVSRRDAPPAADPSRATGPGDGDGCTHREDERALGPSGPGEP